MCLKRIYLYYDIVPTYCKTGKAGSKHLKGQLDPPIGNEKCVFLTENEHLF